MCVCVCGGTDISEAKASTLIRQHINYDGGQRVVEEHPIPLFWSLYHTDVRSPAVPAPVLCHLLTLVSAWQQVAFLCDILSMLLGSEVQ